MTALEQRIIRPLLAAMDRYRYTWALIGIGTLMIAWIVLTTVWGNFSGGPVP